MNAQVHALGTVPRYDRYGLPPLRAAVVSPPITASDGPRECCAKFAAVEEIAGGRSIWKCGVCRRLFAVPHQR